MFKRLLIIIILIVTANGIYSQEVNDYLDKIDLKLRKDKTYLDLQYITVASDDSLANIMKDVPRSDGLKPFSAKSGTNTEYMFVLLNNGYVADSIIVLYVNEISSDTTAASNFFGAVNSGGADTSRVLNFKDMYNLKTTGSNIYHDMYSYISEKLRQYDVSEVPSLLKIQPDNEIRTSLGMSSRDNDDYLNFARINSLHYYPARNTPSLQRGRREASVNSPMKIDASFSNISFAHEKMTFLLEGASLELSTAEKVLNLLPWQNLSLTAGFRTLFNLNGGKTPNNTSYLDAKFMGRFRMNTMNIADGSALLISEKPMLNFTNAMAADLSFTRPLTLPFMNFYFALGKRNFENPYTYIESNTGNYAYYTLSQAQFTMSFYWNTTDKKINRFRMDLGGGYYDIWKVGYDSTFRNKSEDFDMHGYSPLITLWYNFVPANNPLLGSSIRYFDSRLTLNFWLKILELSETTTMRFETTYLGAPIARKIREWENKSGLMFQLRFRYGI